ncbi:Hypothetical predicted protein [Podarcis lilfordi]|uniref:Uncharacterized protein n=1 Tax=Podarcis lilfordi TaxID=74358 RepID=A0AA35PN95_9SAUR|nr:Hypothetical predicted protein [Podarcis lilfordi]
MATKYLQGKEAGLLKCVASRKTIHNEVRNVVYLPELTESLLSVSTLTKHAFNVNFNHNRCVIAKDGVFYAQGIENNGVFVLDTDQERVNMVKKNSSASCIHLWPKRL